MKTKEVKTTIERTLTESGEVVEETISKNIDIINEDGVKIGDIYVSRTNSNINLSGIDVEKFANHLIAYE